MNKKYLIFPLSILIALVMSACGASVERTVDNGNQAFIEEAYQEALALYSKAIELSPDLAEPVYNLANTLYRLGAYPESGHFLNQAIQIAADEMAEMSFYNLGNNFFQQEQLDAAVEAYKEALRIAPHDMDAKYNLELALQQSQQEQEQQEENDQQGQGESGENQDEQDSSGQEQQADESSQDDGGEPDQSNQDSQDQTETGSESQNQSQEETDRGGQGNPQPVEGLSEEQARQLLAAIGEASGTLQEKLQEIFGSFSQPPEKDW